MEASIRSEFDGGGSILKSFFVDEVRKTGRIFNRAFEWCAGMGEIGKALLDAGLCKTLVLADINHKALMLAPKEATIYVSDNMKSIPDDERFDLVVSNPPNYFNIQKSHPMGKIFYDDLRPNDRGWEIHKEFYRTIKKYLAPGAVLLIHEVQPFESKVYMDHPTPYDIRDEPPITSFMSMIRQAGLRYEGCKVWNHNSSVLKISNNIG